MITREQVEINNRVFTRTYSNAGLMIRKTGTEETYSDAYDVLEFTYEETDIEIEPEPASKGWITEDQKLQIVED